MQILKTLAFVTLAGTLLAGCEGTVQSRDDGAVGTTMQGPDPATTQPMTSTQVLPGSGMSAPDPLDDPNSLLSTRVIYFDYDSSEIRPADLSVVEAHARYLLNTPGAGILLEGHTDERGSREYNVALGERRGLAVAQVMQLLGVPAAQLRTVSYGEERPAVDGQGESVWQQNRRVELSY